MKTTLSWTLTKNDNFDFGLVFAVHVLRHDLVDAGVLSQAVLQRELGVVVHVHDRYVRLGNLRRRQFQFCERGKNPCLFAVSSNQSFSASSQH